MAAVYGWRRSAGTGLAGIPHITPAGPGSAYCPGCGAVEPVDLFLAPGDPAAERKHFMYFQCETCKTIRLSNSHEDSECLYGEDYYSHIRLRRSKFRAVAYQARNLLTVHSPRSVYRFSSRISEHPSLSSIRPILSGEVGPRYGIKSRWLDVGCGAGSLLSDMRAVGFANLTGIDPFLSEEVSENGLNLRRASLFDLDETFDVVMAHHTLEHIDDPESALAMIKRLIGDTGVALIRIPLAGSYAWRRYGGEWGNLDAPRHNTLFTECGFRAAALRANLNVVATHFDSTCRSIYQSEARLIGRTELKENVAELFTSTQIDDWKRLTNQLNRDGSADQAAFYLTARSDE